MALLDPLFGSTEMGKVFSDSARLQRMLDFEASLAKAEKVEEDLRQQFQSRLAHRLVS